MKIRSAHKYTDARVMASRIKDATDDEALDQAALDMAPLVPENSYIIPAPSSSGLNRAMEVLASKIEVLVPGATMVNAIQRITPVPSSLLLRRAGKAPVSIERHITTMALTGEGWKLSDAIPRRPITLIDNVITAGNTATAVEHHIGRPIFVVVYADASRETRTNPSGGMRICIAGSREYANLENIDLFLQGLAESEELTDAPTVVHGAARGVDEYAGKAAHGLGFHVEEWPADWSTGKGAGPARNRAMIPTCDYLYAFWDGRSRGTANAIQVARKHGIPYEVIL